MLGDPTALTHPIAATFCPSSQTPVSLAPLSAETLLLDDIENHALELTQIPVQIG